MKKEAKLALVLIAIVAGGLLAFAGAEPESFKTLSDVYAEPEKAMAKSIDLKATVKEGTLQLEGEPLSFVLTEEGLDLPVEWASVKPVPNHEAGGTLEGRTVVVSGRLEHREDGYVFLAEDMKVGCASKYEPNETAAPAEQPA